MLLSPKFKSLVGILTLWFSSNFKSAIFLSTFGWVSKAKPSVKSEVKSYLNTSKQNYVFAIEEALNHANRRTNYPNSVYLRFLEGMSGQRFRAFLNHLSKSLGEYNYLEIGVWKGSTAKCALHKTRAKALLVDNWSQFGGPRSAALRSLSRYLYKDRATLLDIDFNLLLNYETRLEPNVYYYDGPHDYKSHYTAVELITKFTSDEIIFIIDDWNWDNVKNGTLDACRDFKLNIWATWQIIPSRKDRGGKLGSWHNGIFIALVSRVSKDTNA